MAIFRTLFYIWLFLLPWQTRFFWDAGGPEEFGRYSLFLTDLLFLVWAVGGGIARFRQKGVSSFQREGIAGSAALAALFLGALLSLIGAESRGLSLYFTGRLIFAGALIALVPLIEVSLKTFTWVLTASGVVQAGLAVTQFLLQKTWENKWLGLALHLPETPGTSALEVGVERWMRAYGTLPHPDVLGGFLVLVLVLLIFWYWHLYAEMSRAWSDRTLTVSGQNAKNIGREGIYVLVSYLICFAGLIVTFSRSAWLGFIVVVGLIFIKISRTRQASARSAGLESLIKLLVASALIFVFFFGLWSSLFSGRIFSNGRLEEKSVRERAVYQEKAVALIKSNWLTGVGLGNFSKALRAQGIQSVQGVQNEESWPDFFYQPVHNIYLLSLAEIGLAGAVFWIFYSLWLGKGLAIGLKRTGEGASWSDYLSAGLIFSLVGFSLAGFFDHYFWSLPFGIWLFALAVAMFKYCQSRA